MSNEEKKEIPRWLDRLFTIAGSTIVLTVIAVPTFFSKVDNLNANMAEVKMSINAMRSDIKTLAENVNKARVDDLNDANKKRVEDVERIGNLSGRVKSMESTLAQITLYRWKEPKQ